MPNLAELAFAEWQYEEEKETQARIVKAREYHDGDQASCLTPRLREFIDVDDDEEFSMNLTRGVVEAVTERLIVSSFKCTDEASAAWSWQVWQNERLDAKQNDVHEDTERDGEKFIITDWSDSDQRTHFIPHDRYTDPEVGGSGEGCKAHYANDDPNQELLYVSKRWVEKLDNGRARNRITLYFPDRIEKYLYTIGGLVPLDNAMLFAEGDAIEITAAEADAADENSIVRVEEETEAGDTAQRTFRVVWPKPWVDAAGEPLGIPVAHFRTSKTRPGAADAWPLQSAVNKTLIDLLASADTTAFRMYKAFGWYPTTDSKEPEADGSNLISIAPGQILGSIKSANDASFEAIEPAPMDSLIATLQQLTYYLAIVTRTPTSRYQITGNIASSDTLKQQDQSLLAKIAQRQMTFGDAWEDAMSIARHLQNAFGGGADGQLLDETAQFQTVWQSAEIRDRNQELAALQIEKDALGVPLPMLWAKAGYKPDEIQQMLQQREDELAMNLRVASADLSAPVIEQPASSPLDAMTAVMRGVVSGNGNGGA